MLLLIPNLDLKIKSISFPGPLFLKNYTNNNYSLEKLEGGRGGNLLTTLPGVPVETSFSDACPRVVWDNPGHL